MKNQRGFSTIIIILLVIVVSAALGAGSYLGYNWWQGRTEEKEAIPPTPAATPDPTVGWQIYTDQENGFSLKFPPGWTTKSGSFPSTHGQTLKDTAFLGPNEKVFVTVRVNPDGSLEAFVGADGVSNIQNATIDQLPGFAAITADAYRVYLGQGDKVYMFTFPGAKSDKDLSANQVNLLTSIFFTSSSTTPSTTPTTP